MINQPPDSTSLESKYSLVIAVAKRARQIVAQREPGVVLVHKPVTIALEEIAEGKIRVVSKTEQEVETGEPAEAQPAPEPPVAEAGQEEPKAPEEPEDAPKPQ